MSGEVVVAAELAKRYRGAERLAVEGVSFTINSGETVGLLGPNGAGKTTLIKMICGVTAPSAGSVRVFDVDPMRDPVAAKNGIGAMHQGAPFDMMLPAIDSLRTAARFRGLTWRQARPWALELAEYLGLKGALQQLAFQLSGGQRQRLQLVRALITIPRLLILDEPSAGLDVTGRHQVERFVSWLRSEHGVTVLWTSHHIEELERNCHRVMVIGQGRLLRFARPRELIEEFGSSHLLVTVEDADASRAILAWAETAGLVATADGLDVRIGAAAARQVLPDLFHHCTTAGIRFSGISIASDSLEEVFMKMTQGGEPS